MVECNTEVIAFPNAAVEDVMGANAFYCPDFQIPCPEVIFTLVNSTVVGAAFRIAFTTSIPTVEKYRQREIVGGVPGLWSGFLGLLAQTGTAHSVEQTTHNLNGHRVSNKAASSLWDYQYQLIWNGGLKSELWPSCGNTVVRVQYPDKFGVGGDILIDFTP